MGHTSEFEEANRLGRLSETGNHLNKITAIACSFIDKRKGAFLICVLLIFVVLGCSNNGGIKDNMPTDEFIFETLDTSEHFFIEWDFLRSFLWDVLFPLDESEIVKTLNEKFNVTLTSRYVGTFETEPPADGLTPETLPDIFQPLASIDDHETYVNSGLARPIPDDMIRKYAPRYYKFISGLPDKSLDFYSAINGETYFLLGIELQQKMLDTFSVYRYDWLEEIGVTPRGKPAELSERIYFTEEPFTSDEFVNIMTGFTRERTKTTEVLNESGTGYVKGGDETYGFSAGSQYRLPPLTLLGMFGMNWTNVRQDGKAVMSVGSDAYREFLSFMERLVDLGVVFVTLWDESAETDGRVGWWNASARGIFLYYKQELIDVDANAKLLVTPPEIGPDKKRGVDFTPSNDGFTVAKRFMINSNVDDEKLARILVLFDAISFDPEFYVLTKYGVENERFYWDGGRFDSPVVIIGGARDYAGLFNTGMLDGRAGKLVYEYPSSGLYEYATSSEALSQLLEPHKTDPDGLFLDEYMDWSAKFQSGAVNKPPLILATDYYRDVLFGAKNVGESWEGYMSSLKNAGFDEYNELINRYPKG